TAARTDEASIGSVIVPLVTAEFRSGVLLSIQRLRCADDNHFSLRGLAGWIRRSSSTDSRTFSRPQADSGWPPGNNVVCTSASGGQESSSVGSGGTIRPFSIW